MPIIFSTLTSPNTYVSYRQGGRDVAIPVHSVTIAGGANSANKRNLITPHGVATTVSEKDLEHLRENPVFQMHMKNGFITIDAAKDERDADKVAASMEGRDDSAPLVEQDYAESNIAAPTVNKESVVTPTAPPPRRPRNS